MTSLATGALLRRARPARGVWLDPNITKVSEDSKPVVSRSQVLQVG